jgi:hypothetical protein
MAGTSANSIVFMMAWGFAPKSSVVNITLSCYTKNTNFILTIKEVCLILPQSISVPFSEGIDFNDNEF